MRSSWIGARALALTAALAFAGIPAGPAVAQEEEPALPEVSAPDFADGDAVTESLEAMLASIEEVKDAEGWRALRAIDECDTVLDLVEGQMTATAYDAEGGERLWRLCFDRYQGLKLH
jgi:hypothetical protein